MYQTSISAKPKNQHYLDYISRQLTPILTRINGISALSCTDEKSLLSIACEDNHKNQVSDAVITALSEILSVGYKNEYFKNKLNIDKDSFLQNVVVNTMCIFDTHKDKKHISHIITDISNLSIEGYCNFRLKDVCEKWDEIINITNAYDIVAANKNTIKDFLLFLVESIPIAHQKVTATVDENHFTLFDENNKQLNLYTVHCDYDDIQELLIHNLICHRPKQVDIVGNCTKLSKDFWAVVRLLFRVNRLGN